jgi:hypothetical protein
MSSGKRIDVELNGDDLYVDLGGAGKETLSFSTDKGTFGVDDPGVPFKLHLLASDAAYDEGAAAPSVATLPIPTVSRPEGPSSGAGAGSAYEAGAAVQTAAQVEAALAADNWRTQVAAVEHVGLRHCRWATETLIRMYEEEEGKDLYPAITTNWPFAKMLIGFGGFAQPGFPEDGKRRFRLKAVILEALGRLGATEAGPLILRTLEHGTDFYPVLVQACIAAARTQLTKAIPLLERSTKHFEVNTKNSSILALKLLKGELGRAEFEEALVP